LACLKLESFILLHTLSIDQPHQAVDPIAAGCYSLSRLLDEQVVAGCEGDVCSALGMLWGQAMTGQTPWMANIAQVSHQLLVVPCFVTDARTGQQNCLRLLLVRDCTSLRSKPASCHALPGGPSQWRDQAGTRAGLLGMCRMWGLFAVGAWVQCGLVLLLPVSSCASTRTTAAPSASQPRLCSCTSLLLPPAYPTVHHCTQPAGFA